MPRIYPLAGKEDTHIDGRPLDLDAEKYPENYNAVTHGLENALNMANKNRSIGKFFTDGIKNVVDMYIGVAPVVLAFRYDCINACRIHFCFYYFREAI